MRFDREQSEQCAGQGWLPFQQRKRPAEQACGEKSILADNEVREYRRKRGSKQIADGIADDGAYREQIEWKGDGDPGDVSSDIGQQRQQHGDKQKRRRIRPAEITVERMPDAVLLDELENLPVIGCRNLTGEGKPAGPPGGDEVRFDTAAVRSDQPDAIDKT